MEKIVIETLDFSGEFLAANFNDTLKINEMLADGWQIQQMQQAILQTGRISENGFWYKTRLDNGACPIACYCSFSFSEILPVHSILSLKAKVQGKP